MQSETIEQLKDIILSLLYVLGPFAFIKQYINVLQVISADLW